jgi:hypothetical protein
VGVAAAFGFAGTGAGGALAVASDFLAGVNSSVEAVGSTFAAAFSGTVAVLPPIAAPHVIASQSDALPNCKCCLRSG